MCIIGVPSAPENFVNMVKSKLFLAIRISIENNSFILKETFVRTLF